jgi:hypothetical protein
MVEAGTCQLEAALAPINLEYWIDVRWQMFEKICNFNYSNVFVSEKQNGACMNSVFSFRFYGAK